MYVHVYNTAYGFMLKYILWYTYVLVLVYIGIYYMIYTFKHMHNMELQSAWLMVITLMCDK